MLSIPYGPPWSLFLALLLALHIIEVFVLGGRVCYGAAAKQDSCAVAVAAAWLTFIGAAAIKAWPYSLF